MKQEAQRIAIAEACGTLNLPKTALKIEHLDFRGEDCGCYFLATYSDDSARPGYTGELPDYLNDLNTMHEAVRVGLKTVEQCSEYLDTLYRIVQNPHICPTTHAIAYVEAAAAQRAEAFLRTIGKWVEE